MKVPQQSRAYVVEAGDQTAALEHPLRATLLMVCIRSERRVGDLARELGVPLPKAHYHVKKLVACGLLQMARAEPRRGRAVKFYKAVAEVFLVNLADIREQVSELLARELRRSIGHVVSRREAYLRYYIEGNRPRVRLVDSQGSRLTDRTLDHWKIMRLTPGQRSALASQLAELIARYEDAQQSEGELYLVHASFAPKLSVAD